MEDILKNGYFAQYGGSYVPEMLRSALDELTSAFEDYQNSSEQQQEFLRYRKNFIGGPSPLFEAERFRREIGTRARIFVKNEGANLTGAHKINHCVGQALLAKKLGKTRLIAETGAGQHGVATACVAAHFGMHCTVYMGAADIARQRPNVERMKYFGAEVVPVYDGAGTLKDAVSAALRDFMATSRDAHYVIGSVLGPHPYPIMNRAFQSLIGQEVKQQLSEEYGVNQPTHLVACVGGGSNAMGLFSSYLANKDVRCIGVEAGGTGEKLGEHASRIDTPSSYQGVFHGYKSYFLQTEQNNIAPTHSIAAGLDYPGIGPELAQLADSGRVTFSSCEDDRAVEACMLFARTEGILPALESSHALGYIVRAAKSFSKDDVIVIGLSGSGDKDIFTLARHEGNKDFKDFLVEEVARYA